jgi:hypothetical protein
MSHRTAIARARRSLARIMELAWDIISDGINRSGNVAVKTLRSQKIGNHSLLLHIPANDVMILIDHSGSICNGNPDGNPCARLIVWRTRW